MHQEGEESLVCYKTAVYHTGAFTCHGIVQYLSSQLFSKQWLDQEALKPAHERRPLPVLSSQLEAALAGERPMPVNSRDISEFNSQMTQKFQTESLENCTICGRSFK